MITTWTCERPGGRVSQELAVQVLPEKTDNPPHILVVPALFDEANKLRRLTIEVMRRLGEQGVATTLPDLPGMNESLAPLQEQTLSQWRTDTANAANRFDASHILAIRGGALIAPQDLPGWHYAAASGERLIRSMLRARIIASREAGREETTSGMTAQGIKQGIEIGGWQLGARLFAEMHEAEPLPNSNQTAIQESTTRGSGLWLRAEPSEDPELAEALAAQIAGTLSAS